MKGLVPSIDNVDKRDGRELGNQHRAAIQLQKTAPKQSDGTPGTMVIVDSGSGAKLYIKGKRLWWYLDLERK